MKNHANREKEEQRQQFTEVKMFVITPTAYTDKVYCRNAEHDGRYHRTLTKGFRRRRTKKAQVS
jgi:hypothetical protein